MKPGDIKEPLAAHVATFVAGTRDGDIPAETARVV